MRFKPWGAKKKREAAGEQKNEAAGVMVRHFGTTVPDGRIVSSGRRPGALDDHGPSPLQGANFRAQCDRIQGRPFLRLFSNADQSTDQVIAGYLKDADRSEGLSMAAAVTVQAVEMVFNDCDMIDQVHGRGTYERIVAGEVEEKVLELARRLYAESAERMPFPDVPKTDD